MLLVDANNLDNQFQAGKSASIRWGRGSVHFWCAPSWDCTPSESSSSTITAVDVYESIVKKQISDTKVTTADMRISNNDQKFNGL